MSQQVGGQIQLSELIEAYAQSLGTEGAKITLKKAIDDCGLPHDDNYALPQVLLICQSLKKQTGFVEILARCLETRYRANAVVQSNANLSKAP
jgi:hypothetical protein